MLKLFPYVHNNVVGKNATLIMIELDQESVDALARAIGESLRARGPSKSKRYLVNGRAGQYELTTGDGRLCFYMDDTNRYEYFPPDTQVIELVNG
jgi:hypothetical protein